VDAKEAQAFANDNGCEYMETSAKSGKNINELFESILPT
jgi:hypothetical protein